MTESARLADASDIDSMQRISVSTTTTLGEARGGSLLLARESVDEAEQILDAVRQGRAIVGTYDDTVLGYGWFSVESLPGGVLLGRIHTLVVEPEARGVGIGAAMMDLLLEVLGARGCSSVDSLALPGDRETKNFFESYGLKARLLIVNRSLVAPPPGPD